MIPAFTKFELRPVLWVWGLILLLKIPIALLVPLANDEAYYWVWGHNPSLSYYDHPPLVAWLFWLGSHIEHIGHAARLPAVLLAHCALLIWIVLLRAHLTAKQLCFWLVFVSVSPLLGLGSLIATPDLPLLFFWSLSLLLFLRAFNQPSAFSYAIFGAALGMGFLSKYLIVLFLPSAAVWLILEQRWQKIHWPFVPWTILTGVVFSSPVLVWNAMNEWESLAYQLGHGLSEETPKPLAPLEYLGGQIAILFPPVLWLATRRREPHSVSWLHAFAWVPLGFFFLTSFFARPEANWPMMAYPAVFALAVLNSRSSYLLHLTLALWVVLTMAVVSQAINPWMPIDPRKLKTNEAARFEVLIEPARSGQIEFLGSYQMAASVSYALKTQIPKLPGMKRRDVYDFLFKPPMDRPSITVARERGEPFPPWIQDSHYTETSITPVGSEFEIVELRKER